MICDFQEKIVVLFITHLFLISLQFLSPRSFTKLAQRDLTIGWNLSEAKTGLESAKVFRSLIV